MTVENNFGLHLKYRCEYFLGIPMKTSLKRLKLTVYKLNLQYFLIRKLELKITVLCFRLLLNPAHSAEWRQSSHRRFSLNRYFKPRSFSFSFFVSFFFYFFCNRFSLTYKKNPSPAGAEEPWLFLFVLWPDYAFWTIGFFK